MSYSMAETHLYIYIIELKDISYSEEIITVWKILSYLRGYRLRLGRAGVDAEPNYCEDLQKTISVVLTISKTHR